MARRKDVNWAIPDVGQPVSTQQARLALLMDIRDELKQLNRLLHCAGFMAVPFRLERIRIAAEGTRRNTAKKRRAKSTAQ